MRRRSFLATLGATALAGCSGVGGLGEPAVETRVVTRTVIKTPTPSPSPTPTASPSPTPAEPRPTVEFVNLVSDWQDFGDARDNRVDEVAVGDPAVIAFRHRTKVHDGTFHVVEQVRIYDDTGRRIDIRRFEDEQLTEVDGVSEWEHALRFDTWGWEPGEHTAEVIIRDEVTGRVSDPRTTDFDVVD